MAPYFRTIFSKFMLDVEHRRRTAKAAEARRRKIYRLRRLRMHQFYVRQLLLSFLMAFFLIIIDRTVFRSVWKRPRNEGWWTCVQEEWDDSDWIEHFRMKRGTFGILCTELEPYIGRQDTRFRKAIPTPLRVAATLWKLETNIDNRSLAQLMAIGRSTACEVVNSVCEAITSRLMPRYISLPTEEEQVQNIMDEFEGRTGFPQVIGAIDGCHIPIIAPNDDPEEYHNRKGFYSFILQAFVDSRVCFRNINVSWPGRVHDARVLVNSALYQEAQNGSLVPNITRQISGVEVPPLILGDPAYPLKPWLMKPYRDTGHLTREQGRFNRKLSQTRMVVENSFGRLKGRWRCLLKRLDCETVRAPVVISACCVLHNICEINREEFNEDWLDTENLMIARLPPLRMGGNRHAVAIRNAISQFIM